jgi:hypothetical protein
VAAKQYVVLRSFRRTDRRTGAETRYVAEKPYTGAVDKPYLLDPSGPDGNGPLIAEVVADPISPPAAGDSGKEKS